MPGLIRLIIAVTLLFSASTGFVYIWSSEATVNNGISFVLASIMAGSGLYFLITGASRAWHHNR